MAANTLVSNGLEPIERASRDELAVLQLQRLRWSVQHAFDNVPHYRRSFAAAGVHPSELKTLADLARFPFLTKQDFRDHYPYGLFAIPREKVVRIHASSGTTGKPTVVGYSAHDLDMWAALVARSMRAAGARPGDIVHIAYGYGLFTGGLGAHYGAERLGCTVIPMSGGQTERQAQLIGDFGATVIMATPSYILNIAEALERRSGDVPRNSLRIGVLGAEPWTQAMRAQIESRLGIDALDIYGLSEVLGPGVAAECLETKDGLVVWEDHFYPEIIDSETGAALPDGEQGELVLTSLTKEALPVIRYRTRDLTRLLPPTARAMRRLGTITGRSDDMLIIRGVNVFPSQIEELVLGNPAFGPHFRIELTKSGHLDVLTVVVETASDLAAGAAEAAARQLTLRIKSQVGVTARLEVAPSGSIERSTGKAQRVVDKRSPGSSSPP